MDSNKPKLARPAAKPARPVTKGSPLARPGANKPVPRTGPIGQGPIPGAQEYVQHAKKVPMALAPKYALLDLKKEEKDKVPDPAKMSRYDKEIQEALNRQTEEDLTELQLETVTFSLFSYEELKRIAVVNITNPNIGGDSTNGLNDPRMGVIEDGAVCRTCFRTNATCPGHLGAIFWRETPIYHPKFISSVTACLRCVCHSCKRLLYDEQEMREAGFLDYSGQLRLKMLERECKKKGRVCNRFSTCTPNPSYTSPGTRTKAKTKGKDREVDIEYKQITARYDDGEAINMTIENVSEILEGIIEDDARLMGFRGNSHPSKLIMYGIPVPLPVALPPVRQNGETRANPLASVYRNIITTVNDLKKERLTEEKKKELISKLFRIVSHLIDNSDGQLKNGQTEIISYKQQLQGKEAVYKGNTLGKRVNFSSRTVLGPDPTLRFGQIRVPKFIAQYNTQNRKVRAANREQLQGYLDEGKVAHITKGSGELKGSRYTIYPKNCKNLLVTSIVTEALKDKEYITDLITTINKNTIVGNSDDMSLTILQIKNFLVLLTFFSRQEESGLGDKQTTSFMKTVRDTVFVSNEFIKNRDKIYRQWEKNKWKQKVPVPPEPLEEEVIRERKIISMIRGYQQLYEELVGETGVLESLELSQKFSSAQFQNPEFVTDEPVPEEEPEPKELNTEALDDLENFEKEEPDDEDAVEEGHARIGNIDAERLHQMETTVTMDDDEDSEKKLPVFEDVDKEVTNRFTDLTFVRIGDNVDRHLMDGDYILFNRQPTLTKYSIMGYEVVLGDELTFGMHLSSTTPHNADFDGDEGNAHALQTEEANEELRTFASAKECIMSTRNNAPAAGIVFDGIIGSYLLTDFRTVLKPSVWEDCFNLMISNIEEGKENPEWMSFDDRLKKHHLNKWSGRALFSAALPWNLYYQKEDVIILDGIIVSGQITKDNISTNGGSLVQVIFLEYGSQRAAEFLTDIPRIIDTWLTHRGFSVGFSDCKPIDQDLITEKVKKTNLLVETLSMEAGKNSQQQDEMEKQIASAIAKLEKEIKDEAYKIYEEPAYQISEIAFQKFVSVEREMIEKQGLSLDESELVREFRQKQHALGEVVGIYEEDAKEIIIKLDKQTPLVKETFGKTTNKDLLNIVGFVTSMMMARNMPKKKKNLGLPISNIKVVVGIGQKDLTDAEIRKLATVSERYGLVEDVFRSFKDALYEDGVYVKENLEVFHAEDTYNELVKQFNENLFSALESEVDEHEIKYLPEDYENLRMQMFPLKKSEEMVLFDNPIIQIRNSGLSASKVNVHQAIALIGQQRYHNERLKKNISGGKRVNPYFDFDDVSIESRGFISENFLQGYTPNGLFANLYASREGLINTAISTAVTGDLYTRLVRAMDNLKIQSNGSVTNFNGTIVQFEYGTDGMDPASLVPTDPLHASNTGAKDKQKQVAMFMDVASTITDLNRELFPNYGR